MEKIYLEDVHDAMKREKLFLKAATKQLGCLRFKAVEKDYDGEFMRPLKEVEVCDEVRKKHIDNTVTRYGESRKNGVVKKNKEGSFEEKETCFGRSGKEKDIKYGKRLGKTKISLRKRSAKKRQKRRRR